MLAIDLQNNLIWKKKKSLKPIFSSSQEMNVVTTNKGILKL